MLKTNTKTSVFFLKLLFVWGLASAYCFVNAQDSALTVNVNSQKVLIDNKLYYVHVVQKSETLYSISRAYGVTQKEITDENSGAAYGLIEGQALKIPVKGDENNKKEKKKKGKGKYLEHEVLPGQTLYFISRKYNVPLDVLIAENPEAEFGIRPKQILQIPKNSINSLENARTDTIDALVPHKVEKQETLYSISRYYNVAVEEIIQTNPDLVKGLKASDTIYIPQKIDIVAAIDTAGIDTTKDEVVFKCRQPLFMNKTIKVALLLPFQISVLDSVPEGDNNVVITPSKIYKVDDRTNYIVEFYEGFLIALDSLKKLGENVELYVYDTKKDTLTVKNILRELETVSPDIIFGPVFSRNLKLVSEFALLHKTPIVSPISQDEKIIEDNPYYIKVIPSRNLEIKRLAQYVSNLYNNHLVLVHDGNPLYVDQVFEFRDELFSNISLHTDVSNLLYDEIVINDTVVPDLSQALYMADTNNTVIVLSHREAYASPIISQLNLLKDDFLISVVGLSEFQKFPNIDLEHLHNLNLQFVTPFYIDYESSIVNDFIKKYRRLLGSEPVLFTPKGYNFTMLGYDLGFYFINAMNIYGESMLGCLPDYYVPLLLSGYNFERMSLSGGFENRFIEVIEYKKDFTTEILNFTFPVDKE